MHQKLIKNFVGLPWLDALDCETSAGHTYGKLTGVPAGPGTERKLTALVQITNFYALSSVHFFISRFISSVISLGSTVGV